MSGISKWEDELVDNFYKKLINEKINFFLRIVEEMGVKLKISVN